MPEQIKRIDLGDLTEAVTTAVHRSLAAQKTDPIWRNPRIICGLIFEPNFPRPVGGPQEE